MPYFPFVGEVVHEIRRVLTALGGVNVKEAKFLISKVATKIARTDTDPDATVFNFKQRETLSNMVHEATRIGGGTADGTFDEHDRKHGGAHVSQNLPDHFLTDDYWKRLQGVPARARRHLGFGGLSQSPPGDTNAVDLSVTVQLISGSTRNFTGFTDKTSTRLLKNQVCAWASKVMDEDSADLSVKLMLGDRKLHSQLTFQENQLCDGAPVSAVVQLCDSSNPPSLVSSSSSE